MAKERGQRHDNADDARSSLGSSLDTIIAGVLDDAGGSIGLDGIELDEWNM